LPLNSFSADDGFIRRRFDEGLINVNDNALYM